MTIANNAKLIQTNNSVNTGNITVNRNSNALSLYDSTIWSSPFTNPALFLKTFSPSTLDTSFYNYKKDPLETVNVVNEIKYKTITSELEKIMEDYFESQVTRIKG